MSKKIIAFILLSLMSHNTFAQNWGAAAIVSAIVGATSAGGCTYCIGKTKQLHHILKTEKLSPKEFQATIYAREQQRLLAWTLGILSGVSIISTIFCTYKWRTQPSLLEQHNITELDIDAINQMKSILEIQAPPTPREVSMMLSGQQYDNFLREIEGVRKRDLTAKTIQLLKYSYIALMRNFPNNFQATHQQLTRDTRHSRRGRYRHAEVSKHLRVLSFDTERYRRSGQSGIMQRKIEETDRKRNHASKMLTELDRDPNSKKSVLNEANANEFFGEQFSDQERDKMIEIAHNLAQAYIELHKPLNLELLNRE